MKTKICRWVGIFWLICLVPLAVLGAEGGKPMDGVFVEAVESYPNLKENTLGLGIGLYPFNAYFMGVLISGSYVYHFTPNTAWEMLNLNYAYSVQNELTTELADRYRVNPKTITRLDFMVSTAIHYTLVNGKFLLMKNYLRYFRMAGITGIGLAKTNASSSIAPLLGLRFEANTGDSTSWFLDLRDMIAVSGLTNYVTFTTGLNFSL